MEYTEIRPIRPNQSVVLAGLGVQGKGVGRCRKDRCNNHHCPIITTTIIITITTATKRVGRYKKDK